MDPAWIIFAVLGLLALGVWWDGTQVARSAAEWGREDEARKGSVPPERWHCWHYVGAMSEYERSATFCCYCGAKQDEFVPVLPAGHGAYVPDSHVEKWRRIGRYDRCPRRRALPPKER